MAAEIITKEDLQEFREQLLQDIKQLLGTQLNEPKKLLKSYQVKHMLKISSGTLQTLRTNGTLPYKKVGGIIYYQYENLLKLTGQFK